MFVQRTARTTLRRTQRLPIIGTRSKSAVTPTQAGVLLQNQSFGRRAWNSYTRSLNEHPFFTKATFAAVIFFVSDSATQWIVHSTDARNRPSAASFQWDASRAVSGAGFGIVATAWLHHWWSFLEATVGRRLPVATHRLANTMTKVVLDQAIGAPMYIYTYYVLTNFLQEQLSYTKRPWEQSLKETSERASVMLLPTMLQHWRLWVPVHSFNFYFVPLHHRVMIQNFVLMFWSGYLSFLNSRQGANSESQLNQGSYCSKRDSYKKD